MLCIRYKCHMEILFHTVRKQIEVGSPFSSPRPSCWCLWKLLACVGSLLLSWASSAWLAYLPKLVVTASESCLFKDLASLSFDTRHLPLKKKTLSNLGTVQRWQQQSVPRDDLYICAFSWQLKVNEFCSCQFHLKCVESLYWRQRDSSQIIYDLILCEPCFL